MSAVSKSSPFPIENLALSRSCTHRVKYRHVNGVFGVGINTGDDHDVLGNTSMSRLALYRTKSACPLALLILIAVSACITLSCLSVKPSTASVMLRVEATMGMKEKNVLVLFTSDREDDGSTWCPDCKRAFPVVERLAASLGRTMVVCEVGSMRAWKDKNHPFRHDENLWLSTIPTLIVVDGNADSFTVEKTLDGSKLEACSTAQAVEELVKPFLT